MSDTVKYSILLFSIALSAVMHSPHFTKDLMSVHVWRQAQTQSTINNFFEEDMNILNPRKNERGDGDGIHRMEFPLFQWIVALSYNVFGQHIWLTRLIVFLISIGSILGMFKLVGALFGDLTGTLAAWAFIFSPSFFYYSINPLPDNLALCFAIWGAALYFQWIQSQQLNHLVWSGLAIALSTLVKLPFIAFYALPFTSWVLSLKLSGFASKKSLKLFGVLSLFIFPLVWYAWVIPTWADNPVLTGVLNEQSSLKRILGYWLHTLGSTLPELLLNYAAVLFFIIGLVAFFKKKAYEEKRSYPILVLSFLVLVYYFFEANAIAKVHDYYLFPFYPLLFILVGYGAKTLITSKQKGFRRLAFVLLLALPFTCYLRMQVRWDPEKPEFNKDLLVHKDVLRSATPDSSLVVAGNDMSHAVMLYYIDKKGWAFDNDNLSASKLEAMRKRGAAYLYSDSRSLEQKSGISQQLDSLVAACSSVHVYQLKR